ncbi:hypothetical protein CL619_00825 [archaeon]|nr:hypothetical protein [archaeon]|tara:strand:+ start:2236 stop:2706 length:471 start_codon:yes stop_codon:yes gene_type:complete
MGLEIFTGTYTRSVDKKGRIWMPKPWENKLTQNDPFYLFKAPQLDYVSLIPEKDLLKHYRAFFGAMPNPIELGLSQNPRENVRGALRLLESLVGWGPNIVNISPRKKSIGMRLQVPKDGFFRSLLIPDEAVSMIGINDHIAIYQGTLQEIEARYRT